MTPQYAKYTFFEAATQHGFVEALMAPRTEKSRHIRQIIIDPSRGRVYQLFRVANPAVPVFEFVIPERFTTESTFMWREKTRKALEGEWKKYQKALAAKRLGIGEDTTGQLGSTLSSPIVSSTDAPPSADQLASERMEGESGVSVSGPSDPIPASSTPEPVSSTASEPASPKSGSSSRSSSGRSTRKSTSDTARAASTSPKA